jgi:hypothetical protein
MRMFSYEFKNNIVLSVVGPTPEPECDAAVKSLVEMGFSEVNLILLLVC